MRPFPGLRPFDFEDRDIFFGREDQIYSLFRLLEHSRFIAVVGSSGSGKSSLVRAGLLPVIQEESQGSGGRTWRFATLHPGDAPLDALARAVAQLAQEGDEDFEIRRDRTAFALKRSSFGLTKTLDEIPVLEGKSVLLVVDQFEELFRYAATTGRGRAGDALWRDEATNFVQLLLEATRSRSSSVNVLITMRSDFIGDCAQFHGLPEAVSAAQFLVPSLTRDQREDVIRKPIEKAGASIDATLVELLLNDAGSEIDQLPVLQHCLARLWDRTESEGAPGTMPHLGLTQYQSIGTISGALSKHADEVMASLPGLELAVEQVFRALSEVDKEGRATRRALLLSRLLAETGVPKDELLRVLNRFRADDCSFIVPPASALPVLRDESRIDVVHEALLRRWTRISAEQTHTFDGRIQTGWLAAEDADGRFYRALLALLEAESGSNSVTLPLDQVEARWRWWKSRPRTEAWAERYGGRAASVESLFQNSLAALALERAREEEAERREREQERRKIEADESAKRERLEHQAEVDRMRADAAQRLTHRTRLAAIAMCVIALLALSMAGVAWFAQTRAVAALDEAVKAKTAADSATKTAQTMEGQANTANQNEAIAARRERAAAQRASSEARRADTQATIAKQQRGVAIAQTASANQQRGQALNERSQVFLQVGRQKLLDGNDDEAALLLAAAYSSDSHNSVLQLLLRQAFEKLALRARSIQAHDDLITALAFNPNQAKGQFATASSDGSAKLWRTSGQLIHEFRDQGDLITALAFDPSGRYLATVGRDGSAKLHDLAGITPSSDPPPIAMRDQRDQLEGHAGRVNSVVFSHDGKRILTSGSDGKVKIWNVQGGAMMLAWNGSTPGVSANDALFGPDDRIVAACAADGSLGVWDSKTGDQIGSSSVTSKSPLVRLAISPDGKRVAAGAIDGTIIVFDIGAKSKIESHDQHGAIDAIGFDSSGGRVLSASEDGSAVILDAASGAVQKTLAAKAGAPAALTASFNPSGNGIETTYADGSVNLWTLEGDPVAVLRAHTGAAPVAGFSPDGNLLATGGDDGKVYLWHASSPLARADFSHHGAVESIEFDRSGGRMLTASQDGTAAVWTMAAEPRIQRVLSQSPGQGWVVAAHFSADGQRIVTAGGDTAKVWNSHATGASPLLKIHVSAPQKRFTQAAFVGGSHDVIVAQTDTSLANPVYKTNGWSVWSSDGSKRLANEPGWQTGIRSLALTDDGKVVLAISASGYGSIDSSDAQHTYGSWRDVSEGIPDPSGFALGGVTGTIHLVNPKGAEVQRWPSNDDRVLALALSSDGKWLASAGNGGTPGAIWDLSQPGRSHVQLEGGDAEIESALFSPVDSTFLLATSSDGTLKLWDRASGDLVASVSVPASRATFAAFTPDGSAVVIGAQNGGIFLWPIRGGIPSPRNAAALALRESDPSSVSDPLVAQAIDILRKVPGNGK
ncbi:MAG TPA: WD40 repeat domain-containing protein [Candidatus Eremiobacteraceae bacterium]